MLAVPAGASAAVSCTLTGSTLDVDVTGTGDQIVGLRVGTGGSIDAFAAFDFTSPATCAGAPTTANTSSIDVDDVEVGSQKTILQVSLAGQGGGFISTADSEGEGDDEIEISFDGGDETNDNFQPYGTTGNDRWRFGSIAGGQGVNFNIDETTPDGDDVSMVGIEWLQAIQPGGNGFSNTGDDFFDASGSVGGSEPQFTGRASFGSVKQLVTGDGNDVLTAGAGDGWTIEGDDGADTMNGGPGSDGFNLTELGASADTVTGFGEGAQGDSCNYQNQPAAVTVDLRISTAQDTGSETGMDTISGCENLVGGANGDTLIGTSGPNRFFALQGDDTILGGPGNDLIDGGAGVDTASYAQDSTQGVTVSLANTGAQDTVGAGTDTLADGSSDADTDSDTENLIGSAFGDTLTGDARANSISGGPGGDTIELGQGLDSFDVWDGVLDTVNCGPGGEGDTGVADEEGVDTLTACSGLIDFAPQTSLGAHPANSSTINDPTPTYALTANEQSSFQYSVDGGAFTACPSASCTVATLADGGHTLRFRAVDEDVPPQEDLTPVERSITIDTTAPAVPSLASLDPGSPANANTVRVRGTGSEGTVSVYGNQSCTGAPLATGTIAQLAGAGIELSVADNTTTRFAATATDAVGNESACSNSLSYTEDSRAPNTVIPRRPPNRLERRKARYRFGADETGVSFQCKLDRRRYRPCKARTLYRNLSEGPHRLRVRAVDAAGNVDPTPARDRFRVVL